MHELSIRVYYEDTDFGGVVYYANYLKFLERGRTELLREIGIDQVALKEAGAVFVVRRAHVDYHLPARFDDLLSVRTVPRQVKGASAVLGQEIWRGAERLVSAEITIACIGLDGRPERLPADLRARLVPTGEN